MKRLLKNISIFLLPLLLILSLIPVDKRLRYQGLEDDCFNHGIWIYDRIHNNKKDIDLAFIGSSHTINAINDKFISEKSDFGEAVNMGYCRLGRNLSYVFLKELLSKKNIKYLVLEVRENESRYSHPIFPYVAESKDVFLSPPFFNPDFLSEKWLHLVYKIEILQDFVYQQDKQAPFRTGDYGFAPSKDTASIDLLEKFRRKRMIQDDPETGWKKDFHMHFARRYLEKINRLCNKKNTRIVFLYLPSWASSCSVPTELETYNKYGPVLIIPDSILSKQTNWYDQNHLNLSGANELSLWLTGQLNNLY